MALFWGDEMEANQICPECKGTGVYQGLFTSEPCKACAKPTVGVDMAIGESKSVEMSFAMTADTITYKEFIDKAEKNLPRYEGRVSRAERAKHKFREVGDFWKGDYPSVGFTAPAYQPMEQPTKEEAVIDQLSTYQKVVERWKEMARAKELPTLGIQIPPYEAPGDAKVDCDKAGKANPCMGDFALKYGGPGGSLNGNEFYLPPQTTPVMTSPIGKFPPGIDREAHDVITAGFRKKFKEEFSRLMKVYSIKKVGVDIPENLYMEISRIFEVGPEDAARLCAAHCNGISDFEFRQMAERMKDTRKLYLAKVYGDCEERGRIHEEKYTAFAKRFGTIQANLMKVYGLKTCDNFFLELADALEISQDNAAELYAAHNHGGTSCNVFNRYEVMGAAYAKTAKPVNKVTKWREKVEHITEILKNAAISGQYDTFEAVLNQLAVIVRNEKPVV